jgi:glutamate synthase (ferredoxin)
VRCPIPSLLATSGVHHHLVRQGSRTRCALIVESGDAREVHHCALLLGYGAGAVNPYLAFETLDDMVRQRILVGITHERAVMNYLHALNKGILKVMSKMGISTLQSYCGAQVFEAVGLERSFVDSSSLEPHPGLAASASTSSPEEVQRRHNKAFPARPSSTISNGVVNISGGATASITSSIRKPSSSCSTRREAASIRSSRNIRLVDDQSKHLATLRGLLEAAAREATDSDRRMSSRSSRSSSGLRPVPCRAGSISQEAHETLAIAMNRIGGKSNTGEGGEDPARYTKDPNGDWRRSAVKQVASASSASRAYLVTAPICRSRWRRARNR